MKNRVLLFLALFFCCFGQTFGDTVFTDELRNKFESVLNGLFEYVHLYEIDGAIDYYCKVMSDRGYCDLSYKRMDQNDFKKIALEHFDEVKKNLAKSDKKLVKGKKPNLDSEDARFYGILYTLGYDKICQQDINMAKSYFKLCEQDNPIESKLCIVGCDYFLNGDEAAAINGVKSASKIFATKPGKTVLKDLYKDIRFFCLDKIKSADIEQVLLSDANKFIRKAIRRETYDSLIRFIPQKIPAVDSLFACKPRLCWIGYKLREDMDDARSKHLNWTLERLQQYAGNCTTDFIGDEKAFAYMTVDGGDQDCVREYFVRRCISHRMGFAYGLLNDASFLNTILSLDEPLLYKACKAKYDKGGISSYNDDLLIPLAKLLKKNQYAALILTLQYNNPGGKKILSALVRQNPDICKWNGCPISINTEGSVSGGNLDCFGRVRNEDYDSIFRHWRSTFK